MKTTKIELHLDIEIAVDESLAGKVKRAVTVNRIANDIADKVNDEIIEATKKLAAQSTEKPATAKDIMDSVEDLRAHFGESPISDAFVEGLLQAVRDKPRPTLRQISWVRNNRHRLAEMYADNPAAEKAIAEDILNNAEDRAATLNAFANSACCDDPTCRVNIALAGFPKS